MWQPDDKGRNSYMALITKSFVADEKSWQMVFYMNLFGENLEGITIDRSTDGYTRGIIFEHKNNIQSYGESKALGQALIYLARFNRDGVPVPAKICLVGQEDKKCYIYDTKNYMNIVNDISKYANIKASDGIPGFSAGARSELIPFDMETARGMQKILNFVQRVPETVKVDINVHNVYGWATYYYDHATEYRQKPEKKKFFEELRNPLGTLEAFVNPWTGQETDFKYIMDILNDPATQKDLGAFYTPPLYAKKTVELVKQAIDRVPEGNDYVIIDRCAGTGNLEMYLDDGNENILSHVIISTYELKEWMVLKDRYDKASQYSHDVAIGILDKFLCQTLIWTCLTHYAHMRTLPIADNKLLLNDLCFDNLNGKTTLARQKLEEFISNGYELTNEEVALFNKWEEILSKASETAEYRADFNYGLYQIDEEINIKEEKGTKKDGTPQMVIKYGDLNNLIKDMKSMLKTYYINNIVEVLFDYEFLK